VALHVCSARGSSSVARVHGELPHARVALHVAAPVELAAAALRRQTRGAGVAAAAAQPPAAVQTRRRRIALPPLGAQAASGRVVVAVLRRGCSEHQVGGRQFAEVHGVGQELQATAHSLRSHLRRAVELVLQGLSYLTEAGHVPPARLELAGAGHAVTLAPHPHALLQQLPARLVVVQVDEGSRRPPRLAAAAPRAHHALAVARVHEPLAERHAVRHVVAAAGPLEALLRGAPHAVVAAAVLQSPAGAAQRDGVRHARRRDGVHERGLARAFWHDGEGHGER